MVSYLIFMIYTYYICLVMHFSWNGLHVLSYTRSIINHELCTMHGQRTPSTKPTRIQQSSDSVHQKSEYRLRILRVKTVSQNSYTAEWIEKWKSYACGQVSDSTSFTPYIFLPFTEPISLLITTHLSSFGLVLFHHFL